MDSPIRPTCAEINLDALRSNLAQVRHLAPTAGVVAVVKANAYGHGAAEVARTLEQQGVHHFGVALVEEGLSLRKAGVKLPILVLGGAYEGGYAQMVEAQLTPVVFRAEHVLKLAEAAKRAGVRAKAHLKVDTGMGRVGILVEDVPGFLGEAKQHAAVELEGLVSHFANADLANQEVTQAQVERFRRAAAMMQQAGLAPKFRHLSNSAGVLSLPEVRDGAELNLVRPGLMLYGVSPAPWLKERVKLSPVLTWKTAITHIKEVPAQTAISYGGTFVAQRRSRIATLPIGYADGYSRAYSNKAQVLVRGKRAPVAGSVCMDMCMVDVTDVSGAEVGDEVVLMGRQGQEEIAAEELASAAGTISYEVLCGIGERVPRRYVQASAA